MALARGKSLGDHGYKAPEITRATLMIIRQSYMYKYMCLFVHVPGEIGDSLQHSILCQNLDREGSSFSVLDHLMHSLRRITAAIK